MSSDYCYKMKPFIWANWWDQKNNTQHHISHRWGNYPCCVWYSSFRLLTYIHLCVSDIAFHSIFFINSHWDDSLWIFGFKIDLYEVASVTTQILLPPVFIKVHYGSPHLRLWRKDKCFCSVVSDSLQPHGMQHTRLLCPPLSPRVCSNSGPLSPWCHPTISSLVFPFSCSQSLTASGSFPMSQLFT